MHFWWFILIVVIVLFGAYLVLDLLRAAAKGVQVTFTALLLRIVILALLAASAIAVFPHVGF